MFVNEFSCTERQKAIIVYTCNLVGELKIYSLEATDPGDSFIRGIMFLLVFSGNECVV